MKKAYTELLEKAASWIEAHKEEYISEVQGLARIPSVSRADEAQPGAPFGQDCRRVLDYMMERGTHYGFDVQDHDGYAVSVSMGDPLEAIGMIAHLDVVPVGDGWVYPPYGATYVSEHDVLIGRGVSDNKCAAVTALFAMRMLRELGWELKHGLRLLCGSSEETGMQDMKYLVENGVAFPKFSLVPDAAFPVNYGQKGSVDANLAIPCEGNLIQLDAGSVRNVIPDWAGCTVRAEETKVYSALEQLEDELKQRITIEICSEGVRIAAHGRSGHAASPDGCVNAIAVLAEALCKMNILEGSCAKAIREVAELTSDAHGVSEGIPYEDEESGKLTLVYGVVHLKNGVLHLCADSRYCVTLCKADVVPKLEANWTERGFTIEYLDATEPFYLPKTDSRVAALQEIYKEVTGRDDEPYTMGGGTYSRVVPNAISFGGGLRGVEHDMSFLPEGHGGAHGRDEVLFLDNAMTAFRIYAVALAMLDDLMA
ncbi:MAG: Sapep family Mn(2+)-dependent dipeptidase [Clostridia bacterium]|nr:Sapep family Mn(2+)-dependent dipeptidase [Clostridia bacterium]